VTLKEQIMTTEQLKKYRQHKRNATHRGIDFLLSFEEWIDIWEQSGKWDLRGNRPGYYVMSRNGDNGPYALSNVYINSFENNKLEGRLGKMHSTESKDKIREKATGRPSMHKGRTLPSLSNDAKQKISNALKGRKQSEEHIKKRIESKMKGELIGG
jgi:hypothetical protein